MPMGGRLTMTRYFSFQISLVLVFMVSVIVYRVLISIPLFRDKQLKGFASVIASSSGAFVNLIFIMILERIYRKLAYKLTQWGE